MSCNKAIARAVFDSATLQAVGANGVINLPEVTTSSACDRVSVSGGVVTLRGGGTYEVDVNVTMSAAAAGTEDVQLYVNGTPQPGAHALGTAAAAGDLVPMSFHDLVTVECCGTTTIDVRSVPASNVRVANVTVVPVN